MDINETKIRKNELKLEIKNINAENIILEKKLEQSRITALICAGIFTCGHFFGFLIHPAVPLASLIFVLCSVLPAGIATFRYEDKIDKNKEKIKGFEEQIEQINEEINALESLPSASIEKKDTPVIYQSQKENNIIKRK